MRTTGDSRFDGEDPAGHSLDPAAFAIAFRDAHRPLWLIAAAVMRNTAEADDVVQEAALVALSKLHEFRPGSNFVAWMAQMVRFVGLNHNRKRARRPAGNGALDSDSSWNQHNNGHAKFELHPDVPMLGDGELVLALDGVSETARVCLILRTVEGWSYTRIAELLSIPEGTAMSHVHRSRRYLRQRLGQNTQSGGGTVERKA